MDKDTSNRFVFYVNLDEYYPRSWIARTLLPESIEFQKSRVVADLYKNGFLKGNEGVIVIPSRSTHLEKLYDG